MTLKRSTDGKVRVLSLSYGKDSIATIRACELLGYPIDRIVTADVWATQDIPADKPPMVAFKKYADQVILERYGIQVEHFCAMQKPPRSQSVQVERERAVASCPTKICSTARKQEVNIQASSKDSPLPDTQMDGVTTSSSMCSGLLTKKLTYEDIFYRTYTPKKPKVLRGGYGQMQEQCMDSQKGWALGAGADSKQESSTRLYGFPINRGNWCNSNLKLAAVRVPFSGRGMVSRTQTRCPVQQSLF